MKYKIKNSLGITVGEALNIEYAKIFAQALQIQNRESDYTIEEIK